MTVDHELWLFYFIFSNDFRPAWYVCCCTMTTLYRLQMGFSVDGLLIFLKQLLCWEVGCPMMGDMYCFLRKLCLMISRLGQQGAMPRSEVRRLSSESVKSNSSLVAVWVSLTKFEQTTKQYSLTWLYEAQRRYAKGGYCWAGGLGDFFLVAWLAGWAVRCIFKNLDISRWRKTAGRGAFQPLLSNNWFCDGFGWIRNTEFWLHLAGWRYENLN